eukprot:2442551-Rhodomonas_salina.2
MPMRMRERRGVAHLSKRTNLLFILAFGLYFVFVEGFTDQCPASSFVASCQLDSDAQQGTFLSPSEPWIRCVPKTCPDFPHQENGKVSGLPAIVGDTIQITCDPGWEVTGGSATPRCQPDCTFSSVPSCSSDLSEQCKLPPSALVSLPLTCVFCLTGIRCQPLVLDNGERLPSVGSGQSVSIECQPGFRAELSVPSLLSPCRTSIEAK